MIALTRLWHFQRMEGWEDSEFPNNLTASLLKASSPPDKGITFFFQGIWTNLQKVIAKTGQNKPLNIVRTHRAYPGSLFRPIYAPTESYWIKFLTKFLKTQFFAAGFFL